MPTPQVGANAPGGPALRREGLPRHVDRRPRRGDGRPEGVALRAHRLEGRSALGGRPRWAPSPFTRPSTPCPRSCRAAEKIRLALRAHLRVIAEQLEVATVFIREWRYLEGERRDEFIAERRRYEDRFRALFREGRELGGLRTDLDDATATLLALSAANWAYTWLRPGVRHRRARRPVLRVPARRHARLRDTVA